jgi:hypothetical protein
MSEPDQSLTPAEQAEALASAESVQEIYAALAPEVLDADLEPPVEVVSDDVLNRQVVHAVLVTHDERFGIWGGLSERERRRLRRAAAAAG